MSAAIDSVIRTLEAEIKPLEAEIDRLRAALTLLREPAVPRQRRARKAPSDTAPQKPVEAPPEPDTAAPEPVTPSAPVEVAPAVSVKDAIAFLDGLSHSRDGETEDDRIARETQEIIARNVMDRMGVAAATDPDPEESVEEKLRRFAAELAGKKRKQLTIAEVREIRDLYATDHKINSKVALGKRFGVSAATIHNVVTFAEGTRYESID